MIRNSLDLASACIAMLMLVQTPNVQAQSVSGGICTVRKFVIAGGGGDPQGASYRASVTVGQSATQVSNGGGYRLVSGYHQARSQGGGADLLFRSSFEDTPCAVEEQG